MLNYISHYNLISASVGLIFSLALFFRRKEDRSNMYLSFVFFIFSYFRIISFSSMLVPYNVRELLIELNGIFLPFDILHPLFLYFYIKNIIDENFKLNKKHIIHFIPFIIFFILFRIYSISNDYLSLSFIKNYLKTIYYVSINSLGLIYSIVSLEKFIVFNRRMEDSYSSINKMKTIWIYSFLILMVVNYIIRGVGLNSYLLSISNHVFYTKMRIIGDLCYDAIILFTAFFTLYTPLDFYELKIVESRVPNKPKESEESGSSIESTSTAKPIINEKKAERLYNELLQYMDKEKPYLENSLTLKELADNLGMQLHQLSLIINSKTSQNFHNFINTYRVEEAKRLIEYNIKKNLNETLLNIAMDSGFNSKTSFNTFFKKSTGLTPTEYKKKIISSDI